jgi:hypothetical protein
LEAGASETTQIREQASRARLLMDLTLALSNPLSALQFIQARSR